LTHKKEETKINQLRYLMSTDSTIITNTIYIIV